MKKALILAIFAILALSISSCRHAYVKVEDNDGEITMKSAGGETGVHEYFGIVVSQELAKTLKLLEEQQRKAIAKGDMDKAKEIQSMIDEKLASVNYGARGGSTRIKPGLSVRLNVTNPTGKIVQILNGPYAGTILNPGEKTEDKRPWSVGFIQLKYRVYTPGGNSYRQMTANIPIPKGRNDDISFYDENSH